MTLDACSPQWMTFFKSIGKLNSSSTVQNKKNTVVKQPLKCYSPNMRAYSHTSVTRWYLYGFESDKRENNCAIIVLQKQVQRKLILESHVYSFFWYEIENSISIVTAWWNIYYPPPVSRETIYDGIASIRLLKSYASALNRWKKCQH